jgi:hypothetical protein
MRRRRTMMIAVVMMRRRHTVATFHPTAMHPYAIAFDMRMRFGNGRRESSGGRRQQHQ